VLIVFGALLLLVAAGFVWWRSVRDEVRAKVRQEREQGAAFAVGKDQNACMSEGRDRRRHCGGNIACRARIRQFVRVCLKKAAPVTGFCDDVPKHTMTRAPAHERWRSEQCELLGLEGPECWGLLTERQDYCHPEK
jgi:hypothetical protein